MPKAETKSEKSRKQIAVGLDSDSESEIPTRMMKTIELLINSFTESMNTCVNKLIKSMESSPALIIQDHRARINEFSDQV